MSGEKFPERISDIKDRAETKLEVLTAARKSLVETARKFSLDVNVILDSNTQVVESLISFQDIEDPERIRDMQYIVLATVKASFDHFGFGTDDIIKFFAKDFADRLPGSQNI